MKAGEAAIMGERAYAAGYLAGFARRDDLADKEFVGHYNHLHCEHDASELVLVCQGCGDHYSFKLERILNRS